MAALTDRFAKAVFYSSMLILILGSRSDEPYLMSRSLGRAALVLGAEGDEDEAIAALFLNIVDPQANSCISTEVRGLFGNGVMDIIARCRSSDYRHPRPLPPDPTGLKTKISLQIANTGRVALADTMIGALMIQAELATHGSRAWDRYGVDKDVLLGHYHLLDQSFRKVCPGRLSEQFGCLVSELECWASPYVR